MAKDKSCEERIDAHKDGRIEDFRAMENLVCAYDQARLEKVLEDSTTRELYEDIKPDGFEEIGGGDFNELAENARQRIAEYPLGTSSYRVFRVDLSTGGPGDWLEAKCSGDTPRYEPAGDDGEHYEVETITYHFNDWFDHAERVLVGLDFLAAREFMSEVVPELID